MAALWPTSILAEFGQFLLTSFLARPHLAIFLPKWWDGGRVVVLGARRGGGPKGWGPEGVEARRSGPEGVEARRGGGPKGVGARTQKKSGPKGVVARRGGGPKGVGARTQKKWGPEGVARRVGCPKFHVFFSPPPEIVMVFLPSLGVFSCELLVVTQAAPKPPVCVHTTAREPKRGCLSVVGQQTPPKFNEKDQQEREKRIKNCGGRGKKERNFGRSGGGFGPNQQPHHQHEPRTTTNDNKQPQHNTQQHTPTTQHTQQQHRTTHSTQHKQHTKIGWPKMDWPKVDWPKLAKPLSTNL